MKLNIKIDGENKKSTSLLFNSSRLSIKTARTKN